MKQYQKYETQLLGITMNYCGNYELLGITEELPGITSSMSRTTTKPDRESEKARGVSRIALFLWRHYEKVFNKY